MRSTVTSAPSSKRTSRRARAVGPSSTACVTSRPPWATRSSRRPRGCGPRSPSACPSGRRATSRRRCRSSRPRPARRSARRAPRPTPRRRVVVVAPRRHRRGRRRRGGRAGHRPGAGRQQRLEHAGSGPDLADALALHTPGHRLVTLHSSSHAQLAQVVVTALGAGLSGLVESAGPRPRRDLPALGHCGAQPDLARTPR